jgi:hypothetical protein
VTEEAAEDADGEDTEDEAEDEAKAEDEAEDEDEEGAIVLGGFVAVLAAVEATGGVVATGMVTPVGGIGDAMPVTTAVASAVSGGALRPRPSCVAYVPTAAFTCPLITDPFVDCPLTTEGGTSGVLVEAG